MIFILVGITGVSLTLVFNICFLICGRLIYGFAAGVLSVATPRMIEEYVPMQLYSSFTAIYVCSIFIGSFFAMMSATVLPPNSDT